MLRPIKRRAMSLYAAVHGFRGGPPYAIAPEGVEVTFHAGFDPWHYLREKRAIEDLVGRLGPQDTFVDIGAAAGMYAVTAKAGSHGREVHAIEPQGVQVEMLRENAAANGVSVEIHRAALSDGPGELTIPHYEGGETSVDAVRGEDLDLPTPDCAKVDVEGAEPEVFDGYPELLDARALYVEVHPGMNPAAAEAPDRLQSAGFDVSTMAGFEGERYLVRALRRD